MVGGCIASWASLLYHVLLYCCQWVGRSIRCYYAFLSCVHGFVFFFSSFSLFAPAIPARSGIVQRSTSMYQFRFFHADRCSMFRSTHRCQSSKNTYYNDGNHFLPTSKGSNEGVTQHRCVSWCCSPP